MRKIKRGALALFFFSWQKKTLSFFSDMADHK